VKQIPQQDSTTTGKICAMWLIGKPSSSGKSSVWLNFTLICSLLDSFQNHNTSCPCPKSESLVYHISTFRKILCDTCALLESIVPDMLMIRNPYAQRVLCGVRLEYLHRKPASHKRQRKGNPVSNETVIYGYGSFTTLTSEWCVLQNTDPSSCQRGSLIWKRKNTSD
jgi:hypothetical protein